MLKLFSLLFGKMIKLSKDKIVNLLKYIFKIPEPNIYIGYAHGFLFIAYVILAVLFCIEKKWSLKRFIILFIASLLPFGTFYIDKKYLKPLAA